MFNSLLDDKIQSNSQGQDQNIQFISMEIRLQNYVGGDYFPRLRNWSILDDDLFEESLTNEIENKLNDIDSGKEKLNKYSSVDDYLKHIDDILEE